MNKPKWRIVKPPEFDHVYEVEKRNFLGIWCEWAYATSLQEAEKIVETAHKPREIIKVYYE